MKGIVFLGTPHRGADLAKLLKNLLAAAFAQRTFVGQLGPNSEMITEINRAFRGRSVSLELVSFYESTGVRGIGVFHPFYHVSFYSWLSLSLPPLWVFPMKNRQD